MRLNRNDVGQNLGLSLAGWIACGVLSIGIAVGGDPKTKNETEPDYKSLLPRIPPRSPQESLRAIQVLPGFHVELAAAEPLVRDPVAMAFDENGRLYVVEMCDYSEQDKDFLGTIRLLEDTDGDGTFDRSRVFVDKLSWPTAVTCYNGGIFVGAAPDILYCKDTDGDGKADVRRVVFTGFGRNNVQGLLNSFQWGLDNRIHGATSSNGGLVRRADRPDDKPIDLRGRNFAFNPRTLELTPISGASQHGMTFDDWGRWFVCHNSDHIQQLMYEDCYLARNPYLVAPSPKLSIAVDGPQADVYRISPVEPWRILRTKLRVAGKVRGPIEGGGRPAGYFTSATGITIYRGDAWPEEMRGQAFVGDVGSNIVHRKKLVPNGVAFRALRIDDHKEFLASRDIWFRPVQFANAPDGCLYIADMCREVIEHPLSLPPAIKKHLDLTSGRDRGRILRIVPDHYRRRPLPELGRATTAELVRTLTHRNGWHRDTAHRLLFQRQDYSAIPLLRDLVDHATFPQARLHALYVLDGLGALNPDTLLKALSDPHPGVREHAIRLSELLLAESPVLRAQLKRMVNDKAIRVRYQLAFTLGEFGVVERVQPLAAILKRDGGDRWVRLAALSSLGHGGSEVIRLLVADRDFSASGTGRRVLTELARMVGRTAEPSEVASVWQTIEDVNRDRSRLANDLTRGLMTGLAKSRSPLRQQLSGKTGRAKQLIAELLRKAQQTAVDEKQPLARRLESIRTLGLGRFGQFRDVFERLLHNDQPQAVQRTAIETMARYQDASVGELLVAAWPSLTPKVRAAAADALFSRPEWLNRFLDAVADGRVSLAALDPARLALLRSNRDPAVRQRFARVAKKLQLGRRADVIARYRAALSLRGDPARGKKAFAKVCAGCHRLEGVGNDLAPNLATSQNRSPETLLTHILDPNREVNPLYLNYIVATKDGRTLTGIIASETATSITLKRADNQSDTILRIDIEELRSSGQSIMPEGLEKDLDLQTFADLLSYLMSIK